MKKQLICTIKIIIFGFFGFTFQFLQAQDTPSPYEQTVPLLLPDEISDTTSVVVPESSQPSLAPEDNIKPVPPTVVSKKFISGIEIGIDYLKLAGLFLDFETKYEGMFGILISNNYFISVEGGTGNLMPERPYKNGKHSSEGKYGRIGLGYRIHFDDKNSLTVGVNYAMSVFKDSLGFEVANVPEFLSTYSLERDPLRAQWYEFTVVTETVLFRNLYTGAVIRLRVMGNRDKPEPIDTYSIPGYGRSFDKTIPAMNLFLKYKLRF